MKKQFFSLLTFCSIAGLAQQKNTVFYFDFDKDSLNTNEQQRLNNWITENRESNILKIEGFTDKTGVDVYNIDLSERRIDYISGSLEVVGFDTKNTVTSPYGEQFAKAGYSAPDRKVVVTFEPKKVTKSIPAPSPPKPTEFTEKVKKAIVGDKIRVPNLNFYNNSDIVLPASQSSLEELLQILLDNPRLKIDIQGHICCQKNEQWEISLRRARAVYNYLVRSGIETNRLSYKSFGSKHPIYPLPEKTEEERVANRRVEIEILQQ